MALGIWRSETAGRSRSSELQSRQNVCVESPCGISHGDLSRRTAGAFEFLLPTAAKTVPPGLDWLHEVKYDGYRLRVERNGDRIRQIPRGGRDWTKRFPASPRLC